jgi:hypothetical protein
MGLPLEQTGGQIVRRSINDRRPSRAEK